MVGTLAPSASTSGPSLAGVFLGHQGCLLVHFLSPFWVLSLLPALPVPRWYLPQPQQQLLPPSPSYVFCVSCAFYPFYASYPSFSSSSFHPLLDLNSLPVTGSGLGFQPFLQVTSLQKGNRTEQEMEGPDAFSVLAQGILMQSVMKILVLQIVGLGWKPLSS